MIGRASLSGHPGVGSTLFMLAIIAIVAVPARARAHATQVWLSGVDPAQWKVVHPGEESDYLDLFRKNAPWQRAASQVNVFKISTQYLLTASDYQLRNIFKSLKDHHISLALEAPMLNESDKCGHGVEGYSKPDSISEGVSRIKQLGGKLAYIAMDEPLWFGHQLHGLHACQLAIPQLAKIVAARVANVERVFPSARIGDIEPFAVTSHYIGWLHEIAAWIDVYHSATGNGLAFFDVDMDWHHEWRPQLAALVRLLTADGIKLGIIYDGDPGDTSGAAWARHAEERFVAVEADSELVPYQAIIQTWMRHPAHMLPESRMGTMTWLVNRYVAAPTKIVLRRINGELEGELVGRDSGHLQTLPGQRLQVAALDIRDMGPPAEHRLSGVVPQGATNALFILRINAECGCDGRVNATIGKLHYGDIRTGQVIVRTFAVHDSIQTIAGTHIEAASSQKIMLNTRPWQVKAGDRWTADVPIGATASSRNNGYLALVFLRADRKEAWRTTVWIQPAAVILGEVTTAADGSFTLVPSRSVLRLNPGFRVEFAGSSHYRFSSAVLH